MSGYSSLAGSVGKALRMIADHIERKQKAQRHEAYQKQVHAIEADPIGWLSDHFSVSKPVSAVTDTASPPKPKPRSIKFDKHDAERLAKYILELEYGYEQL